MASQSGSPFLNIILYPNFISLYFFLLNPIREYYWYYNNYKESSSRVNVRTDSLNVKK